MGVHLLLTASICGLCGSLHSWSHAHSAQPIGPLRRHLEKALGVGIERDADSVQQGQSTQTNAQRANATKTPVPVSNWTQTPQI